MSTNDVPASEAPRLRRRGWWRQPSASMLLVLAASLVVHPWADASKLLRLTAQCVDIVVVLMVVRMIRAEHLLWTSGWLIGVPTVALQVAYLLAPGPEVELAMLGALVVFHAYAVVAMLTYVLRDDVVTLDELFAIASTYVLLALLWASAYAIVVHFDPAAIFINPTNDVDGRTTWPDLVYYSMTTLTSTGYGEITPVSPAARALAMLQQLVGVLFVAIVIARLTGLNRRRRD
jgi:hypothetical protein